MRTGTADLRAGVPPARSQVDSSQEAVTKWWWRSRRVGCRLRTAKAIFPPLGPDSMGSRSGALARGAQPESRPWSLGSPSTSPLQNRRRYCVPSPDGGLPRSVVLSSEKGLEEFLPAERSRAVVREGVVEEAPYEQTF